MSEDLNDNRSTPTSGEMMDNIITSLTGVAPKMVEMGEGITAAVFSMQSLKDALLGDETLDEIIAGKRCSRNVGCGQSLVKEDGSPVFNFETKDEAMVYDMEWRRTGLCPTCLDKAFSALDEGDEEEADGSGES